MTDKLAVRGLYKRFASPAGDIDALADISFDVAAGEFVAIVGASGCGKSTLLRIIAGLETASDGRVSMDQKPIIGPDRDRAMVFQDYSLYPWLTVLENVRFSGRLRANGKVPSKTGGEAAQRERAVGERGGAERGSGEHDDAAAADRGVSGTGADGGDAAGRGVSGTGADGGDAAGRGVSGTGADRALLLLELMGLEGVRDAYPNALSGGMRQRVAIARALLGKPEVLLMDEPFGALDAQTREVMHELILHVLASEKRTIVFVTHDVEEAVYLADRVLVLAPGPGHIDSIWDIALPPALQRTRDLKRSPDFMLLEGRILDRIRATSAVQSDLRALRRLTGDKHTGL